MRTLRPRQDQAPQRSSANLTKSNALPTAASREAHPFLHLQRKVGNQAVLQLLHAGANDFAAASDSEGGAITEVQSESPTTNRFAQDSRPSPVPGPAPITIQPKLTVNTPGDIYEQEADHIAEQVMRMPEPKLQPACDCGGGCAKCQGGVHEGGHERLQTKHVGSSGGGQMAAPQGVDEVLASPGQPLDASARAFFEPRFGQDFSEVRVHSGAIADQSASEMNANAYTVGNNMVFGAGRFVPGSADGQRLVAHELAHVVQQSRGGKTLMRDSAPAATGLAGVPEQTRKSLSFDTLETPRNLRLFFGVAGEPNLADNVDEDIVLETPAIDALKDEKSKKTLWRGLRAYARSLFDLVPRRDGRARSNRFNMVHEENLNLAPWKGPDTAFRFTCIGGEKGGKITVKILVEELGQEHQPMAADPAGLEAARATPYGLKREATVPDHVWNRVLRSLGKFPESLIMRIRDVTFDTSGAEEGPGGHQAHFADRFDGSWKRHILLYRRITRASDASFAFLLAHELAHAIDAAPTQGTKGRTEGYVHKDKGFQEAMKKDGGRAKRITSYEATLSSDSEFFAECLALYVQYPQTLKLLRPNIYAWFVTYDQAALTDPKLNPNLKAPSK